MGYKRVKPKSEPGYKRVKPKSEPGYKSFNKKGSKTKIFGKTEEQWGETLRGAKKGVKEYYSKENRKARRKKRLENKSERIDLDLVLADKKYDAYADARADEEQSYMFATLAKLILPGIL